MPGPLQAAGATNEPSEYATLSMDRHITGLWTQRSALRDADVPYLYGKFYSASRFDSLIDGVNREVSSRLTSRRRPGNSVWNANTFPPVNSFYRFAYIQNGSEIIRTIVDGQDGVIYDATAGGKVALYTKSAGAGKTRFLGINTILYFGDGVDRMKIVRSAYAWQAAKTFIASNFIVDTNLNLQVAVGATSDATVANIQVTSNVCTITFNDQIPLSWVVGLKLGLAGLTTIPALNATTQTLTAVDDFSITFNFTNPNVAFSVETGSASTTGGNTGLVQPTWATTSGAVTADGSEQWICKGSSVQIWTPAAPAAAPTLANTSQGPAGGGAWAANTFFWPAAVIVDSNSKLQFLTTSGATAAATPTWNLVQGGTTTDGTAIWTNIGTATWQPNTVYGVGSYVAATYSIRVRVVIDWDGPTPKYGYEIVTYNDFFVVTVGGTSGATTPNWAAGLNSTLHDNTVTWRNAGAQITRTNAAGSTSNITNLENVSGLQNIVDSNGNIENIITGGLSGAGPAQPTWKTATSALTQDNQVQWQNGGTAPQSAGANAWTYAYSFRNSVVGDVSTASPTAQVTLNSNSYINVQGVGSSDPQIDTIRLFRTAQGQPTLVFLADIQNPGAGQIWSYADNILDTGLVAQIPAPIANSNDASPADFRPSSYHLKRIWGFSGSTVIYSGGPDTLDGSGNSAFPPLNEIPLPEQIIRTEPIAITNGGLLVFTTANVYIIMGTNNATFYPVRYMADVGMLNFDALETVGSTFYIFTSKNKFVSLDPGAGYTEGGFPIGDQFLNVTTGGSDGPQGALYNPATTFVSWHEHSSEDTAIYVSDGAVGWFRFAPIATPESGHLWSPRAVIAGGTSAVQSVETSPGVNELLIGPAVSGPILKRATSVNTDNAVPFASWDVRGNITLCESGEIAEIAHIGLKSAAAGKKPVVSLLLGEIKETANVKFDQLEWTSADPPDLPPSESLYSDRYTALQNGVAPLCDNFQLKVDYGTQDAADELLKFSIYGAKHSERRQQ